MLDDTTLTNLLSDGESDRVEFTASGGDLDKIRKAVSALANDLPNHGRPGVVFIGVGDNGECAGAEIDDKLLQKLGGLRSDGKILPFPNMEVGKKTLNGCELAVIQVQPSENPPVKVDNRCWIRVGPRRAQATPEEERRLTEKRRWGDLPFDMRGIKGASVDDLDMVRFQVEYLPSAVSPEVLRENQRDIETQLQALRLTTPDGEPTATAVLMLGKEPQYWFPCAYIQFVRFEGNEMTDPIKDQKEIRGVLPAQLRDIDMVLRANITVALDTGGDRHIEMPDYPYVALRELARNAVIHRDYHASTPVRVYWFADRVEISSPGGVYGAVTHENFGHGVTGYRNPTIAEAMKNMDFMQRFGIGIPTVKRSLRANGNLPVVFDIIENFIFAKVMRKQGAPFRGPIERNA